MKTLWMKNESEKQPCTTFLFDHGKVLIIFTPSLKSGKIYINHLQAGLSY